ncbi:hypothetical protein [Thiomicrospira pelophila]|uniref:hypothetical protein n=1 Tax=Thiomicrospira pelophila TaxID=934 RepID=UPI0004A700E4|nr:hypothetical protein [Thiomicrospira pelophila]
MLLKSKTRHAAIVLYGLSFLLLIGCAAAPNQTFTEPSRPAWTQPGFMPEQGVVRSGSLHIKGRDATRDWVFNQVLVELSKAQFGSKISLNTQLTKSTQVHNDQVTNRVEQVDYAEITSANESALVKAKIKAEWFDSMTQRLYLWVIPLSE